MAAAVVSATLTEDTVIVVDSSASGSAGGGSGIARDSGLAHGSGGTVRGSLWLRLRRGGRRSLSIRLEHLLRLAP